MSFTIRFGTANFSTSSARWSTATGGSARGPHKAPRGIAEWHADVRRLIEVIDVPFTWALMTRSAMQRWSEGRVNLLGDAAPHCHFLPKAR
jgi:hypothetical protein